MGHLPHLGFASASVRVILPHAGEVRDEMLEERTRRLLFDAPGRELEVNRPREAIVCQGEDDDIVAIDGTPTALWPKPDA